MDRRTAIKNISLTLGYSITTSSLASIFSSCVSHNKWTPEFVNESERYALNHIIEIIIPNSEGKYVTTDLILTKFTDKILSNVNSEDEKKNFRLGYLAFAKKFKFIFGRDAVTGTIKEYSELLNLFFNTYNEVEVLKILEKNIDSIDVENYDVYYIYKFLLMTKNHSILGYFTSKEIQINKLNYESTPGYYSGCINQIK